MVRLHLLLFAAALPAALAAQRVVPVDVGANDAVRDMVVWNDQLVVVGSADMDLFDVDGTGVQAWDGTQVFNFPEIFGSQISAKRVAEVLNGELYIGGFITPLGHVARWDGSAWTGLDQGLPESVNSLVVFDGSLVAATDNGLVCRWSGGVWDTLGGRFNGDVFDLAVQDGALYAGGVFTANSVGEPVARLARWTGSNWVQVGPGLNNRVVDLLSTPDGLVLGGIFTADGSGAPLPRWAIWNGSAFTLPALDPLPRFPNASSPNSDLMCLLPDGSYMVDGIQIRGNVAFDLSYQPICAATFADRVFLGAVSLGTPGGPSFTGPGRRNRFAELVEGQHHTVVDAGAMRATVTPTPALFERHWKNHHGLEVPKGEGTHSIYSASPFVAGKKNDIWKVSLSRNNETFVDTMPWAGPRQALVRDDDFYRRYHQVWTLDQTMIDAHAAQWNDPDYEMPYAIATWPGNGNTTNGEPARLAPFQDQDSDGLYEPDAGDHPLIRGDRAAYTIQRSWRRGNPDTISLEYDMHVMVYNYGDQAQEDQYNTTYLNIRLINRSGAQYDSVLVGLYTDLDVGNPTDDLTECDSTRNLWYSYNGTEFDADTTLGWTNVRGYGSQPPAIGVKYLGHPLHAHSAWKEDDNAPFFNQDFVDLLNGTPGGSPHVGPSFSSRYQFPGGEWSDTYDAADSVADRRSLGSIGPFVWAPDDTLCLDIAVIYARATEGGAYASVAALKQRADAVQALYDATDHTCNLFENVVGVNEVVPEEWSAYPSPTADLLTLSGPAPDHALRVTVLDAMGRTVHTSTWPAGRSSMDLDLTPVEDGAYLVVLTGVDVQRTLRVIKGR